MPRSYDPPGLLPTADLNPDSKNLYIDPESLPKYDPEEAQRQLLAGLVQNLGDKIVKLIKDLTGIDLELLFGWTTAAWEQFITFVNDIMFGGINWATATLEQAYFQLTTFLNQVIGGVAEWITSLIPIGWLTADEPNMLSRHGEFPSIASIAENPFWTWDPNVTAAPDGTGSARVQADGITRALRSIIVPVAPEMNLACEVAVRWEQLAYAAGAKPIKLQLIPVVAAGTESEYELPPVTLFAVESPAQSSGWMTLYGHWTAPKAATGVIVPNGVRLRLLVEPAATAGWLWWDRGSIVRTGAIQQSWVGGLVDQWNATYAAFEADTVEQLNKAWKNMLKLFGLESLATDIFLTSQQARELLDEWIIPSLQVTIDSVFAGFANWGVIGEWINQPLNSLAQWVYGIFDTGLTANNAITALLARVSALENPGTQIVDQFNRPAVLDWLGNVDPVNSHPGPNYTVYKSGPGAGNIGILKPGHVGWVQSGMLNADHIARHHQIMDTDNGHISVVFTTGPEPGILTPARNYLVCRCNDTGTNRIEAVIQHNAVWLRHYQAGRTPDAYVDIIGPTTYPNVFSFSGDLWEFLWGQAGIPHRYVLKRNGITIFDHEDLGARATIGATNRYVGFGYRAENAWAIFQSAGASLGIFSAVNV